MSKKFFKPFKKDIEWGTELFKDKPKLGSDIINIRDTITTLSDTLPVLKIKTPSKIQPSSLNTYNGKISEFTKELSISMPNLAPKDRIKLAREMYKEWKSKH